MLKSQQKVDTKLSKICQNHQKLSEGQKFASRFTEIVHKIVFIWGLEKMWASFQAIFRPLGFSWTRRNRQLNIDRFHVTSSLSKIQNERATEVFVLIRHKRRYIYICLQFYSSIGCFVWNPEHFEFQGYGSAWHKAMIEYVEKYILDVPRRYTNMAFSYWAL